MPKHQSLTIIMFHYVRPISKSKFPNIKGLELESFIKQLNYLEENYSIVRSEDVLEAIIKEKKLPDNACWLTFDDGFKDHIDYVMPELVKRKLSGAFFPSRVSIVENKISDVHAIHYILSCCNDSKNLVYELNSLCFQNGLKKDKLEFLFSKYARRNRFDSGDIIYIKRMLQHVLPKEIRNNITTSLFKKYVNKNQLEFAKEIYMSTDEVSKLIKNEMYVGSHGDTHEWLDNLNESEQRKEILSSIEFLEQVGAPTSNWIMCYPYGAYNNITLDLLIKFGAKIGLTTEPAIAKIGKVNPLLLPRLDTNDFPQ